MKRQVSILSAILLTAFFASCLQYNVKAAPPVEAADLAFLKGKKIVLIGFYPFRSYVSSSYTSGNVTYTTTTAVLNYDEGFKDRVKFGTPVEAVNPRGVNRRIPASKVKDMITAYLKEVRRSGLQEVTKFATVEGKENFRLKNFGRVDYYVVATHLPAFEKSTGLGAAMEVLTFFPFLITGGTIPMVGTYKSESVFQVYDRNLNMVREFRYESTYQKMRAWWAKNPETGEPDKSDRNGRIYQPHVDRFTSEFAGHLRNN